MLVDEIDKIINDIDIKNDLQILNNQKNNFNKFKDNCNELKKTVSEYSNGYKLLIEYNEDEFEVENFNNELNNISNIISMLNKNECPDKSNLDLIDNNIKNKEEKLKVKWSEYVKSDTTQLIGTLSVVKNIYNDKNKIEDIIRYFNNIKNDIPNISSKLAKYDEYKKNGNKIISNLQVDNDVQAFLESVASKRATIKQLTPDVIKWLQENNFDNLIKLTF